MPTYKTGQKLSAVWPYILGKWSPAEMDSYCVQYWQRMATRHNLVLKDLEYEVVNTRKSETGFIIKTMCVVAEAR